MCNLSQLKKNGKVPAKFLKLGSAISLARLTTGGRVYSDFHASLGQSLPIVKSSLYQDRLYHHTGVTTGSFYFPGLEHQFLA